MLVRINVFDIQHNQIRQCHQLIQLFQPGRVGRIKGNAGTVDAGVYIFLFCQCKQFGQEVYLHQGFSSCDCQTAAVLVKGAVSFVLFDNVGGFHHGSAVHFPGVRVVTIGTAHGTSLHKHHKARARAVHSAETFK